MNKPIIAVIQLKRTIPFIYWYCWLIISETKSKHLIKSYKGKIATN